MEKMASHKNITLYFTILCALFVALSPQFMGFVFTLIFVIPIYMALNGLKHRKKSGYLIGLGIIPLALAVAVFWIKYFLSIYPNFAEELSTISSQYKIPEGLVGTITLGGFLLSLVMVYLCIALIFKLQKNKSIFN